ncbi:MAG TPA: hypothetical protein VHO69_19105 [Phototrophicaceae bacterium]|nr:hypothetical protein [Phototrophicaceae bacterium]
MPVSLIEAVVVNHNTSTFTELAVRSLLAMHSDTLDVAMTILDNASTDNTNALRAYAAASDIPYQQSGFNTESSVNTHGEVLRAFVLNHPDPAYYLLLDSDICFIQPNTLLTMQHELDTHDQAFAIQPRMTWDGETEMPGAGWHIAEDNPLHYRSHLADQPISDVELVRKGSSSCGTLRPRCHPGCTLVKNTPIFRRVAEHIGFSTAWLYGEAQPISGFYDTFALACQVMKTHNQCYLLSSAMVLHFFCVSYDLTGMEWKQQVCQERLQLLRTQD